MVVFVLWLVFVSSGVVLVLISVWSEILELVFCCDVELVMVVKDEEI